MQFSMQLKSAKSGAIMASVISAASLISGCANTSSAPQSYSSFNKAPQFLALEISRQLEQARVGQQLDFASSPWGAQVTIKVANSYFSAAGRECKQLLLTDAGVSNAVVCRYSEQRWALNRDLTLANLQQE